MAKRFLDTGIWQKQWYRRLGAAEKVAWLYLLTSCDAVGVWDADLELAEFSIGSKVDWDALRQAANGNIEVLENGKWWVVDFCKYQYGKRVRPSENVESKTRKEQTLHDHIYLILRSHGLWERYLATVGTTVQVEVEVEVEVEEEKRKRERATDVLLTTSEHEKLVAKYGIDATKSAYAKLSAYKLQSGRKYKSDYGAILHWVMDEVVKKAKGEGQRKATEGWECPSCHKVNTHTGGMCVYCKGVREP